MDRIIQYIFYGITGPINDVVMSLGIVFTLTSEDPDEIPQKAAFHLGLYRLSKYRFRGLQYTKG